MTDTAPVLLPPNQFPHFYRGGDRIGALRGGPGGPMRPEEWIGSTVTRFGEARSGLSHASRRPVAARRRGGRPARLARTGAPRGVRRQQRAAGQAAGPGPAAAGALPPRQGVRAPAPGPRPRQDRGMDRPRGPGGRRRGAGILRSDDQGPGPRPGPASGQRGPARVAAPSDRPGRRDRPGAGRGAARHRRRRPGARAAGAHRPLGAAGVGRLRGRRGARRSPRSRVPHRPGRAAARPAVARTSARTWCGTAG